MVGDSEHTQEMDTRSIASNQRMNRPAKFVAFMERPAARSGVCLIWFVLTAAGLAIAKTFIAGLKADVPPVEGSSSYEAFETLNQYFPTEPVNSAMLMTSRDGSPLIDFRNESTCNVEHSVALVDGTPVLNISCHNSSALGGGCRTSSELAVDMRLLIVNLTDTILPLFQYSKSQIEALQKQLEAYIPLAMAMLPDISTCPHAVPGVTHEWFDFVSSLSTSMNSQLPKYDTKVVSFLSIPAETKVISKDVEVKGQNVTVNVSLNIPAGELWGLLGKQLMADSYKTALVATLTTARDGTKLDPMSPEAIRIGNRMGTITDAAPGSLEVKLSALGLMLDSIQKGIDETMDLSSMTLPFALLILAGMVRNLRLVIITLINLGACFASAILLMYPISQRMITATTAPALMIAIALAMSIDYSLFLLSRFRVEIQLGRSAPESVAIMLGTSGQIVIVSGATLLLCFLMMLSLPVHFIASMGISAALTVLTAVLASLTLTPVMLLTFPNFFGSNRRWGLSGDACCCGRRSQARDALAPQNQGEIQESVISTTEAIKMSCWLPFGNGVQKFAWVIVVLLLAIAVPVAIISLPNIGHSVGLVPMMPADAPATHTLMQLQRSFGVGAVFPTTLIVVPPVGATTTLAGRTQWLQDSCDALDTIATAVNTDPEVPPFTKDVFSGVMIMDGRCITAASGNSLLGTWSDVGGPYSATKVNIQYQIDPFSTNGQAWVQRLRSAIDTPEVQKVAQWYVYGTGPIQMDVANVTFARLPLMVALMMCVVFAVIGLAFKSLVAPLRAVICLVWVLVITFGLAYFVFQEGMLDFLGMSQLAGRDSGAMSWMSPCMSIPVVVGLGLDYDIFYSERVAEEWEHGYDERTSAVRALAATANTISAAGVIMVVAFIALLLSQTPTLNEIAFVLIVGVLLDCFISTKVIIPCAMSLLGKSNFWPRQRKQTKTSGSQAGVGLVDAAQA